MLSTPSKSSAKSIKKFFTLVVVISIAGAAVLLSMYIKNPVSVGIFASSDSDEDTQIDSVVFLATSRGYDESRTTVSFDDIAENKLIDDEFNSDGFMFMNNDETGHGARLKDGYVVSTQVDENLFNSPSSVSAVRLVFDEGLERIGFHTISGQVFGYNQSRLAEEIKVRAYDINGVLVAEEETDTCLGKSESCTPIFVGFASKLGRLGSIEVVMVGDSHYAIDDLMIQ